MNNAVLFDLCMIILSLAFMFENLEENNPMWFLFDLVFLIYFVYAIFGDWT